MTVRLPRAEDESDRGYLRRLAEANGYEDAAWLLAFMELQETGSGIGRHRGSTQTIAVSDGLELPRWRIDRTRPKVCPECLKERGVLKLSWEVGLYTVCVRHGCRLLHTCSACAAKLTWKRKALAKCDCGFKFTDAAWVAATETEVCLVAAISATSSRAVRDFLSPELRHLTPTELMDLVAALGTIPARLSGRTLQSWSARLPTPREVTEAVRLAADALDRWPAGFERLLAAQITINPEAKKRGARFFLMELREQLQFRFSGERFIFLQDAFRSFVESAMQSQRAEALGSNRRMRRLDELAREFGVSLATATNISALMPRVKLVAGSPSFYVDREVFADRCAESGWTQLQGTEFESALLRSDQIAKALGLAAVPFRVSKLIADGLLGQPERSGLRRGYPAERLNSALARLEALHPPDAERPILAGAAQEREELDLLEICLRASNLASLILEFLSQGSFPPSRLDTSAVGLRRHFFPEADLRKALLARPDLLAKMAAPAAVVARLTRGWSKQKFDPAVRLEAVRQMLAGRKAADVADELGLDTDTCCKWRYRAAEFLRPQKRRVSKLMPFVEWLRSALAENPDLSGRSLQRKVKDELGLELATVTVDRFVARHKLGRSDG